MARRSVPRLTPSPVARSGSAGQPGARREHAPEDQPPQVRGHLRVQGFRVVAVQAESGERVGHVLGAPRHLVG